jgi:leader peptidase (prepilin peptidase)/N-methyltransferase
LLLGQLLGPPLGLLSSHLAEGVAAVAIAVPIGGVSARIAVRFAGQVAAPILPMVFVDLMVAASSAALAPQNGLIATLALGWTLTLLGCIDVLAFRLPDVITLPLMVSGLLLGPALLATPFEDHLIGAVAGYGVIALLGWVFARLRGQDGIGLGDAKLLACAGAWLGWRPLPNLVLIAAAGGLVWVAAAVVWRGKRALAEPIPFGLPLSGAFWILWLLAGAPSAI